MEKEALSLYQLLGQVKAVVRQSLPTSWWIVAEISEMKVNYSGHCYLELIENDPGGDTVRAKARATIWSSVFRMIQPYFETSTHSKLSAGMKVMVKVTAEFHEIYGFSLNVTDIEPSYTVGELARQKLEIISRLKADGVYDMNRQLILPEIPRKIAVISSKTAAGYGDFMDQLNRNPFGYRFYVKLFPAAMQGAEAEQSIINAIDRVFAYEDFFDLVVIIRGGGAQSELNCFNSYLLASHICQFPLPVLTGIGHEQDETIADLVANVRLKTPTAVAEFLIDRFRQSDERLSELSASLCDMASERVQYEQSRLNSILVQFKPLVRKNLTSQSTGLRYLGIHLHDFVKRFHLKESATMIRRHDRLRAIVKEYLSASQHALALLDKKNSYLDPFLILKRGYSVTYYKGKALKDPSEVERNELIETKLAGGVLKSKTM
jgi:exodeoxyribonuclease VII large subunit